MDINYDILKHLDESIYMLMMMAIANKDTYNTYHSLINVISYLIDARQMIDD